MPRYRFVSPGEECPKRSINRIKLSPLKSLFSITLLPRVFRKVWEEMFPSTLILYIFIISFNLTFTYERSIGFVPNLFRKINWLGFEIFSFLKIRLTISRRSLFTMILLCLPVFFSLMMNFSFSSISEYLELQKLSIRTSISIRIIEKIKPGQKLFSIYYCFSLSNFFS